MVLPYLKGDILDIGCGPGRNLELLKERNIPFSSYTGIEIDENLIQSLSTQYSDSKFYKVDLDVEKIPVDRKFDTIVLLAVVEHVFNLKFLFSQLADLLKLDGRIIVTTPTPFGNDIVHRIGTSIGLFDKEGGQDDHIVIFNKKRLQILGNEVGLEIEEYRIFQLACNQICVFSKGSNI
ncbi:class I SAM-dependent methyltransferase [Algoriphagus namhaensis]